jgi:hypothetical protein
MTTGQQPATGWRDGDDAFWCNPVAHLSACLAIGVLVTLAILWLT